MNGLGIISNINYFGGMQYLIFYLFVCTQKVEISAGTLMTFGEFLSFLHINSIYLAHIVALQFFLFFSLLATYLVTLTLAFIMDYWSLFENFALP